MQLELAISILQEASELGIGRKELGLFASGEPFLYSELGRVIREAKALKFPYVYLTTNGSLVTKERAEEVIDAGIDSIRFSINAGTRKSYAEIHGRDDFENVIRNLKYVNEYRKKSNKNVNLSISFVQTKKTVDEKAYLDELITKGVADELIVFEAIAIEQIDGNIINNYVDLYSHKDEAKQDAVCASVFNTIYIDSDGKMDLCCLSQESKIGLGEYREGNLKELWYAKPIVMWRKKMIEGKLSNTVCEKCHLRIRNFS